MSGARPFTPRVPSREAAPPRAEAAARSPRVLLVVRHPVGGIRTFFRYVYGTPAFARHAFELVAPRSPGHDAMLDELAHGGRVPLATGTRDGAAFLTDVARRVLGAPLDLVHAHGFTAAMAAVPVARLRGVPAVVTCHDVLRPEQFVGLEGAARKHALAAALRAASRVHCVSDGARENLLEHLPSLRRSGGRVLTIRNGVETRRFRDAPARDLHADFGLPRQTFLVGFLGRFMAQKGFATLVEAVARLRTTTLPRGFVVLAFADDDGFVREERAEVRARGLDDVIRFVPFEPDVAPSLKGLDVVAMPSRWEACGLLAMEALAAGVPLIGTDCVALGEVLVDTPARVVAPGDAAALAIAIASEMRDPTRDAAHAFAPVAARRFDVGPQATALAALYAEVLRADPSGEAAR